ncbi:MAG: prolyl oligopeptidase family serine peptidase [Acidobacteriota bacterium]|nr:prolyl oligopeptidase family serine peptidase [Acidobacteriota bacterium]
MMGRQKTVKSVLVRLVYFAALLLLLTSSMYAQQLSRDARYEKLEKEGCVTLTENKVTICKYDYLAEGKRVEAVTIRPLAEGKYPGLILIPGHGGTAKTFITLGTFFAQQGFTCLSVTAPGYGKSEGRPDYMGPDSIKAFAGGFKKFKREPFVDSEKMGVFGYSRGGMAASLLTIKLGKEVKAAVFGAGIYDFKKAYNETKFDGIRENMQAETGMTEKAIKERSSILQIEKLKSTVLIIHGENDGNVPTNQALLLRDRLSELKKDFEIKFLPDHTHGQLRGNFISPVIDFLSRKLKGVPADLKLR